MATTASQSSDAFIDREAAPELQPWFIAVKEKAAIKQVNFAHADAEWLRDVLRSEPSIEQESGLLPAGGTPWFQQSELFHALEAERADRGKSSRRRLAAQFDQDSYMLPPRRRIEEMVPHEIMWRKSRRRAETPPRKNRDEPATKA